MTTASEAARAVRLGRFENELNRCGTAAEVADALFEAAAVEVPFAFACLATTDPLSGVITWAYKSGPLEIGDEDWSRAEYGGPDVNLLAEIARRPVPVGVLSVDTGGDVLSCRRFRELMTPRYGFTDEIRVVFGGRGLTWGAFGVYRAAGAAPFTAQDGERLAQLHDVVAEALRRTLFAPAPAEGDVPSDGPAEPAVLIVTGDGRPRQMTRAARERIEDLGGWDHGSLPANLLAVAAQARSGTDVVVARMRLAHGPWLTLRASALEGDDGDVVVTVETARPAELTGLTLIGHGLTAREREIVDLVEKGASTKAIAETLHLSPHTVQDHLKAVFAKLGVNSRRELIARLHG